MRILVMFICLLFLQSCGSIEPKETEKKTEKAMNNGTDVVQYKDKTYILLRNSGVKLEDDEIRDIYVIENNVVSKFVDLEKWGTYELYIMGDYLFYSDRDDIIKVNLKTKETEKIHEGYINCVDEDNGLIYYTIEYGDEKNGFYKIDVKGRLNERLAPEGYDFVKKIGNEIYFQDVRNVDNDADTILTMLNTDSSTMTEIARIEKSFFVDEENREYYIIEHRNSPYDRIKKIEVYGDDIIMVIGAYEGTGNFFNGDTVKVNKNSRKIERFEGTGNRDYFDIIGDCIYSYSKYIKYQSEGTLVKKINIETNESELLTNTNSRVLNVDGDDIYFFEMLSETENIASNDLEVYNSKTGETRTIYEGENAPIKEDSNVVWYYSVDVAGDYIYFGLNVIGTYETRKHSCYFGQYLMKKDGSDLQLLYFDDTLVCP